MASRSDDQVEVWSGGQKNYSAWSNGRVWGRVICGVGTVWDWWPTGCSEVSKLRVWAHADGDARAEE